MSNDTPTYYVNTTSTGTTITTPTGTVWTYPNPRPSGIYREGNVMYLNGSILLRLA